MRAISQIWIGGCAIAITLLQYEAVDDPSVWDCVVCDLETRCPLPATRSENNVYARS